MTNRQVLLTVSLLLIQSFAMANFRAEKSEGLFSAQDFLKQVDCKKPSNFQSSKKQELKIKVRSLGRITDVLSLKIFPDLSIQFSSETSALAINDKLSFSQDNNDLQSRNFHRMMLSPYNWFRGDRVLKSLKYDEGGNYLSTQYFDQFPVKIEKGRYYLEDGKSVSAFRFSFEEDNVVMEFKDGRLDAILKVNWQWVLSTELPNVFKNCELSPIYQKWMVKDRNGRYLRNFEYALEKMD